MHEARWCLPEADSSALIAEVTWLERIVDDWLFDPAGRGARSGLPR